MTSSQIQLCDNSLITPIAGLKSPHEFYFVAQKPVPLAGMSMPTNSTPWDLLAEAGIEHVVCLTGDSPAYKPLPLVKHHFPLQDLHNKQGPSLPRSELIKINNAVQFVCDCLAEGEGVVCHCVGGTGRTGTVLGLVLVRLGIPAAEVISYLDQLNKSRENPGWPESPWQALVLNK